MQELLVSELKEHPKNGYFFDDMTGEKWQEFLESVKTSGVIEPIVVTQDKVIVSGHQRVRACKELGIPKVMSEIHIYDNDDQIIKDLLETNIRQRGSVGGSDIKLGRRIKELERIYGVRQGSANPKGTKIGSSSTNGGSHDFTQDDLLSMLGMDKESYRRAKTLAKLPPEIQDLVESGSVSVSTASRLIAKLSVEDQKRLAKMLPQEKKTSKEVQDYIDQINRLKENYKDADTEVKRLGNDVRSKANEISRLKDEIRARDEASAENKENKQLLDASIFFVSRVDQFLKDLGGYAYLSDRLEELPDKERKNYERAIMAVYAWAENTLNYMTNKGAIE